MRKWRARRAASGAQASLILRYGLLRCDALIHQQIALDVEHDPAMCLPDMGRATAQLTRILPGENSTVIIPVEPWWFYAAMTLAEPTPRDENATEPMEPVGR